jgi:YfiH family protein
VELPAPFRRLGEHIAIERNGAHAIFTTRRGGVSAGPYASLNLGLWTDDDAAAVATNRARAAKLAGVSADALAQGRQVHAAAVTRLADGAALRAKPVEADGQATALADVAPIVLVADCLPVVLLGGGAVAALHAGWRGLAAGVLGEGVQAARELGGGGPLAAAIGPAVGPCCYEVGDEVRAAFASDGPDVVAGRNIDLKAIAARRLREAGVDDVHDVALCTMCTPPELFFSHRRDGPVTGRQAGMAWRPS